jgi:hypothetical protein
MKDGMENENENEVITVTLRKVLLASIINNNNNIEVRGDLGNRGMPHPLHENEDGHERIHDPIMRVRVQKTTMQRTTTIPMIKTFRIRIDRTMIMMKNNTNLVVRTNFIPKTMTTTMTWKMVKCPRTSHPQRIHT